jgi:hypothetical protein
MRIAFMNDTIQLALFDGMRKYRFYWKNANGQSSTLEFTKIQFDTYMKVYAKEVDKVIYIYE